MTCEFVPSVTTLILVNVCPCGESTWKTYGVFPPPVSRQVTCNESVPVTVTATSVGGPAGVVGFEPPDVSDGSDEVVVAPTPPFDEDETDTDDTGLPPRDPG